MAATKGSIPGGGVRYKWTNRAETLLQGFTYFTPSIEHQLYVGNWMIKWLSNVNKDHTESMFQCMQLNALDKIKLVLFYCW